MWIPVDKSLPEQYERVICLWKGEPIVLELREETPSYEETFKPFLYWMEPYNEITMPEWDEVTHWQRVI